MSFIPKVKLFSRQWFYDYTLILIGSFILAGGFVYFITPIRSFPAGYTALPSWSIT